MATTKPYLIRAIHEWCSDEGFTPYLAVVVDEHTRVPREFVRDGQIVLNISNDATHQLLLGNDEITFQTRFNGATFPVAVPVSSVVAIYARENGQGMAFEPSLEDTSEAEAPDDAITEVQAESTQELPSPADSTERRTGHLKRIK